RAWCNHVCCMQSGGRRREQLMEVGKKLYELTSNEQLSAVLRLPKNWVDPAEGRSVFFITRGYPLDSRTNPGGTMSGPVPTAIRPSDGVYVTTQYFRRCVECDRTYTTANVNKKGPSCQSLGHSFWLVHIFKLAYEHAPSGVACEVKPFRASGRERRVMQLHCPLDPPFVGWLVKERCSVHNPEGRDPEGQISGDVPDDAMAAAGSPGTAAAVAAAAPAPAPEVAGPSTFTPTSRYRRRASVGGARETRAAEAPVGSPGRRQRLWAEVTNSGGGGRGDDGTGPPPIGPYMAALLADIDEPSAGDGTVAATTAATGPHVGRDERTTRVSRGPKIPRGPSAPWQEALDLVWAFRETCCRKAEASGTGLDVDEVVGPWRQVLERCPKGHLRKMELPNGQRLAHWLATPLTHWQDETVRDPPTDPNWPVREEAATGMIQAVISRIGFHSWQQLLEAQDRINAATPLHRVCRFALRERVVELVFSHATRRALLLQSRHLYLPYHTAFRTGYPAAGRTHMAALLPLTRELAEDIVADDCNQSDGDVDGDGDTGTAGGVIGVSGDIACGSGSSCEAAPLSAISETTSAVAAAVAAADMNPRDGAGQVRRDVHHQPPPLREIQLPMPPMPPMPLAPLQPQHQEQVQEQLQKLLPELFYSLANKWFQGRSAEEEGPLSGVCPPFGHEMLVEACAEMGLPRPEVLSKEDWLQVDHARRVERLAERARRLDVRRPARGVWKELRGVTQEAADL
ncbi:hypothetical protein VaNZ11_003778, partial [Volvox africanus]